MSNSQTIDKNFIMKWAVVFIAAASIWFMPCNEVYSPEVKKFLFVTALGILLVAFELMDLMAVSMMFPIGYILFGLAPWMPLTAPGWAPHQWLLSAVI